MQVEVGLDKYRQLFMHLTMQFRMQTATRQDYVCRAKLFPNTVTTSATAAVYDRKHSSSVAYNLQCHCHGILGFSTVPLVNVGKSGRKVGAQCIFYLI